MDDLVEQEKVAQKPRKLNTIQKNNKLNDVYAAGEIGPGGARHEYHLMRPYEDNTGELLEMLIFQRGPRNEPDSTSGWLDVDLLEIVRDRLKDFQSGPYACRENAIALTKIEEALLWMNKRVEDRAERGVLGTTKV